MKTKALLSISIGLNAILVGAGCYLIFGDFTPAVLPPSQVPPLPSAPVFSVASPSIFLSVSSASNPVPMPAPTRVQWEKVESDDFPTYVANLRSVGIPEPTVKDIVFAKVTAQYERKREVIEARPAITEVDRREKQRLLDQLPKVQKSVVASLFAEKASAVSKAPIVNVAAAEKASSVAVRETQASVQRASAAEAKPAEIAVGVDTSPATLVPAVMVAPDSAESLSELQVAEWLNLERSFVEQIGGPNQNPDDPEYHARWQTAQQRSDAMFRQKFGTEAFLRYNAAAGRLGTQK